MPVQRIVMPDGSTRAFRESASRADMRRAMEDMCARRQAEGRPVDMTQFRDDKDYRSPDPEQKPDVAATPDQIALAVEQVMALPKNTEGYEWSTTYKDGGFSKWQTLGHSSRSEIDGSGDFNIHFHTRLPDIRYTKKNFFPGPGDPSAVYQTGKPSFIVTPDRNSMIELGVRDGGYFARLVWQRPGTENTRDYQSWQPDNLETGHGR